ncbi:hypothetical protein FRC00_007159 [Tulasnella sp. 408]|nr:hypothetical protein FRC00_007159 [Tulasnella sp. 408]
MRADIARCIAHAEKRFTGMTFDMTFKADSLSAEKREEDFSLTEIMQDCIGHRLERLVNIELMLYLADDQHDAKKLLEVFDKDMTSRNKVNPVDVAHRAALATAVQNALGGAGTTCGKPAPLVTKSQSIDAFVGPSPWLALVLNRSCFAYGEMDPG